MGLPLPVPAPPFGMASELWLFILASDAVLWPSWPFFFAARRALRNRVLNMAVLVVLYVGTGYAFSVATTFFVQGPQFYEAVSVLLGSSCSAIGLRCARAGANDAIRALLDLAPPMSHVWLDDQEVDILTAEVRAGDIVIVRPRERIPVDGVVTEGDT
jgi:Cu2+-exporting ATPase|tara:strand:+ start:2116 stop:2589 length:474 start_codon:yes stop_codon:yes gene_type:complete